MRHVLLRGSAASYRCCVVVASRVGIERTILKRPEVDCPGPCLGDAPTDTSKRLSLPPHYLEAPDPGKVDPEASVDAIVTVYLPKAKLLLGVYVSLCVARS